MKSKAGIAILGGLIGTPVMTVLMYVLAPILGVKTDIVSLLGETLGGWKMGMLVHILNGVVIFPLAFALVFYRLLPGRAFLRGLSFGVTLWLASQLLALPAMGAGLFSSQVGGWKAAMALLVGHIAYGACIGLFATILQESALTEPAIWPPNPPAQPPHAYLSR